MEDNKYRNAKMKKMKIYSKKEIDNATSVMEKTRRNFWNVKAEQLCTQATTACLNKQILMGIIDVSWTLRKTALIEEARKTSDKEVVISRHENCIKPTIQEKETGPNNLERMSAAHAVVVDLDKKLVGCRENLKKAKSQSEKGQHKRVYDRTKISLDGAYTELKRAQDATMKAINVKRKLLDKYLNSITDSDDVN